MNFTLKFSVIIHIIFYASYSRIIIDDGSSGETFFIFSDDYS